MTETKKQDRENTETLHARSGGVKTKSADKAASEKTGKVGNTAKPTSEKR